MTAKREVLERLHAKLADVLMEELDSEFKSPALYNTISKFLADNNVQAAMDETDSMNKLREKLEERKRSAKVINLASVKTTPEEAKDALDRTRSA